MRIAVAVTSHAINRDFLTTSRTATTALVFTSTRVASSRLMHIGRRARACAGAGAHAAAVVARRMRAREYCQKQNRSEEEKEEEKEGRRE